MLLAGPAGPEILPLEGIGAPPRRAGRRGLGRLGGGSAVVVADGEALRTLGPRGWRRLRASLGALALAVVHRRDATRGDALRRAFPGAAHLDVDELPEALRHTLPVLGSAPPAAAAPAPADPAELTARHERLMHELKMAEQVQRSMMPRKLPEVPGVALGAALRPCQHMAGDFYNAFRLDRDRIGFYVGDVMGHGPAAALLSVFAMQVLRTKRIEGRSYEILAPGEALAGLNRELIAGGFPGEPFVTMIYGVLDVPRRLLRYCAAGHPPALRFRRGEGAVELGGGGPLLGVLEGAEFESREAELRPGDRLVFYSDGVDSASWGRLGRGPAGLACCLGESGDRPPQAAIDAAMAAARVDDWRPDDVTMLMAELTA